jgi:hypothetical protein
MPATNNAMAGKYHSFEWDALPEPAKEAAQTLGMNAEMWNNTPTVNRGRNSKFAWSDLSREQQTAAHVLGYNGETWDSPDPLNVNRRDVEENPTKQSQ